MSKLEDKVTSLHADRLPRYDVCVLKIEVSKIISGDDASNEPSEQPLVVLHPLTPDGEDIELREGEAVEIQLVQRVGEKR